MAINETLWQMAEQTPNCLCVSGSRLYGTNREDSDFDMRGFVLPPVEYLIGAENWDTESLEIAGLDHKIYSLKRFIGLALSSDPQVSEVFFTPRHQIKIITPIGQAILDNKNLFLSNRFFSKTMGYGTSEFRKAIGVRLILGERAKSDDDIIAYIRDKKHWDKERMDEFVAWMDEDRSSEIVPSKKDLGDKRKKEFDAYGFGVSNAAHCLRLMGEAIELMKTGNITFPRPNADFLRGIRQGKSSREEVVKIHDELEKEVVAAREKSILPDKPDVKAAMKLYENIVVDYLSWTLRGNL